MFLSLPATQSPGYWGYAQTTSPAQRLRSASSLEAAAGGIATAPSAQPAASEQAPCGGNLTTHKRPHGPRCLGKAPWSSAPLQPGALVRVRPSNPTGSRGESQPSMASWGHRVPGPSSGDAGFQPSNSRCSGLKRLPRFPAEPPRSHRFLTALQASSLRGLARGAHGRKCGAVGAEDLVLEALSQWGWGDMRGGISGAGTVMGILVKGLFEGPGLTARPL